MIERIDELMLQAVADTLENMAFMEVLRDNGPVAEFDRQFQGKESPGESGAGGDGDGTGSAGNCMAADLLIHDPIQGELRLEMSKPLVMKVAAAVFGIPEDDVSEQTMVDIVSEILNTFAGRFMNAILQEDQAFQLGLPEFDQFCREKHDQPKKLWRLRMDGEPLRVLLWGDFKL